ncbi:hypothetical protein ACHJH3_10065, partial [Campylobacter sp. MOP7]
KGKSKKVAIVAVMCAIVRYLKSLFSFDESFIALLGVILNPLVGKATGLLRKFKKGVKASMFSKIFGASH